MPRIATAVALLSLAAMSCGKSEARLRREVKNCSAITFDAPGISACLVAQFRWDSAKATVAGGARQRELDSIAKSQRDSTWRVNGTLHRTELASCAAGGGDVAACLENAHGWDEQRAIATADSLWGSEVPKHRTQIQKCQHQRTSSVGSCLMLYYKWDSRRALALDDSLARAKMRMLNNR